MKTRIIYTSPANKVLTYTTTQPVTITESLVIFFDEMDRVTIKFPLDRCRIVEVQEWKHLNQQTCEY